MSRLSRLALASPRLLVIPALVAFGAMAISIPTPASAQIALGVSVAVAPPPLIDYDQPPLPGPGYLWNPGYWAYGDAGYYWVPGTWAQPPAVGLLWTPPYWGFVNGAYLFNAGYWGATVGFYGGINYGFGFGGIGALAAPPLTAAAASIAGRCPGSWRRRTIATSIRRPLSCSIAMRPRTTRRCAPT
jgi:hypothetical protein